ncbi:MAG: RNA 2',3'-cyclic phosphodiesterase [Alphaproteobacteria bacterium]|nr:RNA 2',3'-cyclic phosphodiesterase [Alphaproteobacteria bacterium]
MIRLFAAIALPDEIRASLAPIMAGIPGAKWTRPENLHLTLRFIGNVDGRLFRDIADSLSHVRGEPFELRLSGVGQFGEGRRVDLVWAGVQASEPLRHLQARIEQRLRAEGLEPEPRKYHPHVTLARLRGAPDRRVADYLAGHGLYRSAPFRVEEFVLFSSFLARDGAIHQAEATYPLGRGGGV